MTPYIITTGDNGRCVLYGYCESEPVTGEPIKIHNARMILYWDAACGGLLGLAANGPKGHTKITAAVPWTTPSKVVETTAVTELAAKALDDWKAA